MYIESSRNSYGTKDKWSLIDYEYLVMYWNLYGESCYGTVKGHKGTANLLKH